MASISSNGNAFAALKTDGSVVTWGSSAYGGNSSAVAAQLAGGVASIWSNRYVFAALKTDGSVVTWGDSAYGGNSSAVAAQLAGGVQSLASPVAQALSADTGTRLLISSAEAITLGGAQRSNLGFVALTEPSGNIDEASTASVAEATETIQRADAALQTIATRRAQLGALQNRFASTIANLQTASQNTSASRSRIQDADFAAETANLSRAQVLQQAATAMVAQANQMPQLVLMLLR